MRVEEKRLKRLFSSVVGGSWGAEPGDGDVDVLCIRGTDFDATRLRVDTSRAPIRGFTREDIRSRGAADGDLIIEKSGGGEQQPVGRAVLWDGPDLVIPTNFAARLRVNSEADSRFVTYLLASMWSDGKTRTAIKQTTGIQNLDLAALLDQRISCPTLQAQRGIADYLDRETARIDGLIAAKRRMIDEFDERFQSALELSLLGDGLAETGSRWYPWLGSNRFLWRLKYLTDKIGSGKTPAGGGESYVDEGVIFLRSQNILVGSLDLADVAHVSQAVDSDMRSTRVLPGDVLLNITGASLGRCCVAPDDMAPANVNQHVCIVRPRSGVSGSMLHYAMRARFVQEQIRQEQVGGNRDGLNFEQVGNLEVCLPKAVTAQYELAIQLKRTEEEQRRAIAMLRDQILLLAERRQALITAAVTGQLDIPEAA